MRKQRLTNFGDRGRPPLPWGILLGVGMALWLGTSSLSAEEAPDRPLPPDLSLIPPNALACVHLRVADLLQSDFGKSLRRFGEKEFPDVFQKIQQSLGISLADLDRLTLVLLPPSYVEGFTERGFQGEPRPVLVIKTSRPVPRERILEGFLGRPQEEKYRGQTLYRLASGPVNAVLFVSDQVLAVAQQAEALHPIIRQMQKPRLEGLLTPVLRKADDRHMLVGGLSPVVLNSMLSGLGPQGLGFGMSFLTYRLLEADLAILTADASGPRLRLDLNLTFAEVFMARRALPAVQTFLGLLQDVVATQVDNEASRFESPALGRGLGYLETVLGGVRMKQQGGNISLLATLDTSKEDLGKIFTQATIQAKQARDRAQSANNLKQIGLAMHNYHSVHNRFPAAITDKQGKPLLSWRVALLPYLEQDNLYRRFHLDEPWDSTHNKPLGEMVVKVYAPIGVKTTKPNLTFYQGFAGPGTCFADPRGIRLTEIRDGTSITILVVEAGEPIPWSKPEELPYDPEKPLPPLGGLFRDGFNALLCDGSVLFIPRPFDEGLLRLGITVSDGQFLDLEKLTGSKRSFRPGKDRPPSRKAIVKPPPSTSPPGEIKRPS